MDSQEFPSAVASDSLGEPRFTVCVL